MLDKRLWDKKKSEMDLMNASPTMKDDAINTIKKDPMNLMKLRHPSILNLIEAPAEDDKYVVFITEPVSCSLACLTKPECRDMVPSILEVKCIVLEIMEALNFMH
jgi:hypothetical protein